MNRIVTFVLVFSIAALSLPALGAEADDMATLKQQMERYRYLRKGIQVVKQLGISRALTLYQGDPNEFRSMIIALQSGRDANVLPKTTISLKESEAD